MNLKRLFSQFEDYLPKLDLKIKQEDFKNLDATSKNITDLKTILTSLNKLVIISCNRLKLEEIEKEYSVLSSEKQKEYTSKIKIYRSDYETRRKNIARIEEKYISQQNMNKLMTNAGSNLSRSDVKKIEREAVVDFDNKVDYQGELINEIGKDLTNAHGNLTGIVKEVKAQGDTIVRIKDNVQEAGTSVKRADKNITIMQRRSFCQKLLLHVLAVTLFIANITIIIYKLS